jgi:hypothetical protein
VQLDGGFGGAEACPPKEVQTKLDGGRIEGIDALLEFDLQGLTGVEPSRPSLASANVLRQTRLRKPRWYELIGARGQTIFDVA